ncbi:MAG: hypothetical protein K9M03_01635 [Kiritimatiellales bacterium]|nr:hypothetical protein [Kiritimatiellales bacterium]
MAIGAFTSSEELDTDPLFVQTPEPNNTMLIPARVRQIVMGTRAMDDFHARLFALDNEDRKAVWNLQQELIALSKYDVIDEATATKLNDGLDEMFSILGMTRARVEAAMYEKQNKK